jgi:hypothetical protein
MTDSAMKDDELNFQKNELAWSTGEKIILEPQLA